MTKAGCDAGSVKLRYETYPPSRGPPSMPISYGAPMLSRVGLPRNERSGMRLLSLRDIVNLSDAIRPRYKDPGWGPAVGGPRRIGISDRALLVNTASPQGPRLFRPKAGSNR